MSEPANLTEWKGPNSERQGKLFTCGRPGRATFQRARRSIGDDVIEQWATGLPSAEVLHIVSLLGEKKDGFSEFSYYPFRSAMEPGTKPTFQTWLDDRYPGRFVVAEFPTTDARGIPPDTLRAAAGHVLELLDEGRSVIVMDSAGSERTARVCEAIGYGRTSRSDRYGARKEHEQPNLVSVYSRRGTAAKYFQLTRVCLQFLAADAQFRYAA